MLAKVTGIVTLAKVTYITFGEIGNTFGVFEISFGVLHFSAGWKSRNVNSG